METTANDSKAKAANKTAAGAADGLTPDIGDLSGHAILGNEVSAFYVAKINNDPKRLNPLRGVIIEVKQRPAEPLDPKDPSKGMKAPKNYFIMKATGRFVVSEGEGEDKKLRLCEIGELIWVDERHKFQDFDKYLPRINANGQTQALEVAWVPKKVVPLAGGRTVLRGDVSGRVMTADETKALGIDATIRRFAQIGGLDAPRALLTEGGKVEGEIPF